MKRIHKACCLPSNGAEARFAGVAWHVMRTEMSRVRNSAAAHACPGVRTAVVREGMFVNGACVVLSKRICCECRSEDDEADEVALAL